MKSRFIAIAAILAIMSTAAVANECQPVIDLVDANLNSAAPVTSEQFAEAQDLRDRGVEACAVGDIAGGLALLNQAKAILGI